MSPLLNNILVAAASVVYVFLVVAVMDKLVQKGFPQNLSRKIVHICAGSWLIFWVLFDHSHWSKYLNIAPAFIWTVLLLVKGFTAKDNDDAVKTMTRTGDRKELLKGPLYFTIVMNLMGTEFYYTAAAAIAMGFLGWGDGLAPVFGQKYGKHKYDVVTEKSFEGSAAFLIFGIFGAVINSLILFGTFDFSVIFLCGIIAVIVEAFSPKDVDNLLIPAVILLILGII